MKKVLFVAHVDSHIRHFHLPYLKYFKEKGYEVHVATSNDENEKFPYCDVKHIVSFERSPLKINNIKAIGQMKKILKEENFELVHCHTPMGGVVTRLASGKARKKGTKIMYTAHGFHFCKGAPIQNWAIYYPIEKMLSKRTDVLITINHEDYYLAKEKFYAKRVEMIHGIGVDDKKFNEAPLGSEEKEKLQKELNIHDGDFVMMYVAELNKNKNQLLLIEAMQEIIKNAIDCKLYLIGKGSLEDDYKNKISELHLEKNIYMLGYRSDVNQLLKLADLYVASSLREGLPINLVEGALSGLPILAKKNRGHNEIVQDDVNGYLFETKDEFISKVIQLKSDKELYSHMKENARMSVQKFILENAFSEQKKIYEEVLK
ncbi:MAG: glycosyltransferase family 4 protein [Clostridia bacterium]|nr:glycosyltransferase family 4 protein [Clostridia bacterium]